MENRNESEPSGYSAQEALSRLKLIALGDEESLVTDGGKEVDPGERVFDELREVKGLAGEPAARELAGHLKAYLEGMAEVQDEYSSIAAALTGIETFEDEMGNRY